MRFYLTVGMLVAVSACGSKNPGTSAAYEGGSSNCSSQFVSDHNSVASAIRSAGTVSDLNRAQSLVTDFNAKYQGVVCKAGSLDANHLDATPTTIDVNAKVATWNSLLSAATTQSTVPQESTGPESGRLSPVIPAPEAPIPSFSRITLEVTDEATFNALVNAGTSSLIQKGRVTTKNAADAKTDFCFLEKGTARDSSRRNGDRISLFVRVNSGKLAGVQEDRAIQLGCKKLSVGASVDWTISDLEKVFQGVAKVTAGN